MTLRFSWPQYRRPWDLDVEILGEGVTQDAVDPSTRRIRLDEVGAWETVSITFVATTTEARPEGLSDPRAYVLVSSARTHTRIPIGLSLTEGSEDFRGSWTAGREMLAGAVALQLQIVDNEHARVVGEAEPWTLVVDASAAPPRPGAPPFATEWNDFTATDAPSAVRGAQDSYAVMDLSGPRPVLRLNQAITGFETLLGSPNAKLERRRLRDTLATRIAHYAAGALFREAVMLMDVDESGAVTLPADPLYRQVLEVVADESKVAADPEDFFSRIARPQSLSALERTRLWAEVDTILDRLSNHAEQVARAVMEVRHV